MVTEGHRSHNRRKLLKVLLLGGHKRRSFEEGDHVLKQVFSSSDDIDQRTILPSVRLDVAAFIKSIANHIQHLSSVAVLADVKLRNQLITATTRWIAVDGDCKAALAIYKARNVAIQPFLLIVRTRHIVTVTLAPVGAHDTSSAGYTGFPAFSRIYRQQRLTYCLTTF